MALYILLGIAPIFLLQLLLGFLVHFTVTVSNGCLESVVTFVLFRFFKRQMHIRVTLSPLRLHMNNKIIRRIKKAGKKVSPNGGWIWYLKNRTIQLKSIYIDGVIGIENDAAATMLVAGTAEAVVSSIVRSALHTKKIGVRFRPQINVGIFSLAIYGIVLIKPTQIIAAAIRRRIHEKRGNSHVSSR